MTAERSVELRFQAKAGYLRLCRLNVTSLAADLGFTVDELDDLRLAVGEAVNWLVTSVPGAMVGIVITAADSSVEIEGRVVGGEVALAPSAYSNDLDDLLDAVLAATVDHYELTSRDGRPSMRLTRSRREP